jgi:PKHD-type hydroxylase
VRRPHILVPNAFPAAACEDLIKLGESYQREEGKVGPGDIRKDKRNVEVADVPIWHGPQVMLRDDLTFRMRHANQFFGLDVDYLPALQYLVYGEGGLYDWHSDIVFPQGLEARKISFVLQLTDPAEYDGGDLQFDPGFGEPPDAGLLRQQGSLIFFPSYTMHRVTPIARGVRKALVGWFHGPAWR